MTGRQKTILTAAVLAAVLILGLTLWFVAGLGRGLATPHSSHLILDRRGAYLGEVPGYRDRLGYWPVPYDFPEKVVVATVETEDRHFFDHSGVYLPSVFRALLQNLVHRRVVSGASTLAMQVARMQSPGPRTLYRKAREASEALLLIRDHGHDRVLRQYLTLAPYGNRVHGIARAARFYFDKPVEDLSWMQAAFLVGLPQAPGRMDPHSSEGFERAMRRARRILVRLHLRGHLDRAELSQAIASELRIVPRPFRRPEALHAVLRWSEMAPRRSGFIHTASLDLDYQLRVASVVDRNLRRLRHRGAGNTAALVVDRDSGEVLVYLGSEDYFAEDPRGSIDYVRTRRPPGSALKPFLYALGLDQGKITAASELSDIQVEFKRRRDGAPYRPNNIGRTFLGPMLAREALANSRNIPALQVLSSLGVEPTLAFFEQAGVRGIDYNPDHYGLGVALGNLNVNLEELVGLYGMLANQGQTLPLQFFVGDEPSGSRRLLSRGTSELIGHILSDPLARQPSFPRGTALEYDYAVAVKTGTSQGYRDSWAVAYSDRLLVGVWVGNHDWRRMNRVGGLTGAGRAVHAIMDSLMTRHQLHKAVAEVAELPKGFEARSVCALSGRLAGPSCPHHRVEHFKPGTEPFETCPYHRSVRIDRRNGLRAGPRCTGPMVEERVMVDLPARYTSWARKARLEIAPRRESPLCGFSLPEEDTQLVIDEPRNGARYVWDPDTPTEFSTVKLAATVDPPDSPIIWLVDGVPVAKVDYPYEFRWSLSPGAHSIQAAMLERPRVSQPVTILVKD